MLIVDKLNTRYGQFVALSDVSLRVDSGEIVAVLGANGAGKTTLMKSIVGLLGAHSGRVTFMGKDVTGLPTHKMASRGLSLVPEGRQIFVSLTVLQNLKLGMYHWCNSAAEAEPELEKVYALFPILLQRSKQQAGTLSGGEQQMLAIARALLAKPKLLMLDEPSQGLAPRIVDEIFDVLSRLHTSGISILLVEQEVPRALDHASRCYVLASGKVVLEGESAMLKGGDSITDAYLGRLQSGAARRQASIDLAKEVVIRPSD